MAYPLRVEFPGACYHVINRGNYRRDLFERGGDLAFERTLGEAAERFQWLVHAYVILDNHFHLGVQLTEPNLSDGMQWLQSTWVRRFNRFRGIVGRPFQGRHKHILVEPGEQFQRVCNYIHLNPVRARIVSVDEILRYPASSLPRFLEAKRPNWLCPLTVLQSASGLPDTKSGWRLYVALLRFLATDDAEQKKMTAEKLSRGWCIGRPAFRTEMHGLALDRKLDIAVRSFAGLTGDELRHEKQDAWERKLQALARCARIELKSIPAPKSHPSKSLLAAAMKLSTSVSNSWLANRLQMGKPASVSQFVRRWLLDHERRASTAALLSRVKA